MARAQVPVGVRGRVEQDGRGLGASGWAAASRRRPRRAAAAPAAPRTPAGSAPRNPCPARERSRPAAAPKRLSVAEVALGQLALELERERSRRRPSRAATSAGQHRVPVLVLKPFGERVEDVRAWRPRGDEGSSARRPRPRRFAPASPPPVHPGPARGAPRRRCAAGPGSGSRAVARRRAGAPESASSARRSRPPAAVSPAAASRPGASPDRPASACRRCGSA